MASITRIDDAGDGCASASTAATWSSTTASSWSTATRTQHRACPASHDRAGATHHWPAAADAGPAVAHHGVRRPQLPAQTCGSSCSYKALTVEFEGIGVLGRINKAGLLAASDQQADAAAARLGGGQRAAPVRDSFFVGFETGGATGDQAEDPRQYLNYRWKFVAAAAGDHAIRDFKFSPDYHVDQILFRHILGTVTNAIYVKPQACLLVRSRQRRRQSA